MKSGLLDFFIHSKKIDNRTPLHEGFCAMKKILQNISSIKDHIGEIYETLFFIFQIGDQRAFAAPLKDGVILCTILNIIKPGTVKKINKGNKPFTMMENISMYLDACQSMGCQKSDLFQTVDLYELQNIPQVS